MEWLSVVLGLLVPFSGSLIINKTAVLKHYVTPNKTIDCPDDHSTYLTLQEYANQPDTYFTNDTILYFEPGIHMLNNSLIFLNIHNFALQDLPDSEVPIVVFDCFVSIIHGMSAQILKFLQLSLLFLVILLHSEKHS